MKLEEITWLAALLDAEGTISLVKAQQKPEYKSRPSRRGFSWNMRVHITNNNIPFLKRAQELVGGTMIESHLQPSKERTNAKPWSNIFFNVMEQRVILEATLPYLIVKRRQAELYLEARGLLEAYNGLGRNSEITDVRDKRMEAIYWELALLNAKGKDGEAKVLAKIAALPSDPRLYTRGDFEGEMAQAKVEKVDAAGEKVRERVRKFKANHKKEVSKYNKDYWRENFGDPKARFEYKVKQVGRENVLCFGCANLKPRVEGDKYVPCDIRERWSFRGVSRVCQAFYESVERGIIDTIVDPPSSK